METTQPAQTAALKRKRTRSPSYPYLNIKEAIERARSFWDAEKRHPAPIDAAAKDWGYEPKSSAVALTVAALKKYGLLEDVGTAGGNQRQVKLTESALKILLTEEGSPEREAEIKTAALRPRLHRELWTKYGEQLPSDQTLKSWLLLEKKFNSTSVTDFIKIYKFTISFAKLTASDIIPDTTTEPDEEEEPEPSPTTNHRKPGVVRVGSTTPAMTPGVRYLPIPLDIGDAPIPVGMSEGDFQLLLDTLNLWKKKIVIEEVPPTPEVAGDYKLYSGGKPYKPDEPKEETK